MKYLHNIFNFLTKYKDTLIALIALFLAVITFFTKVDVKGIEQIIENTGKQDSLIGRELVSARKQDSILTVQLANSNREAEYLRKSDEAEFWVASDKLYPLVSNSDWQKWNSSERIKFITDSKEIIESQLGNKFLITKESLSNDWVNEYDLLIKYQNEMKNDYSLQRNGNHIFPQRSMTTIIDTEWYRCYRSVGKIFTATMSYSGMFHGKFGNNANASGKP